ncbi:uncharacterized protein LOC115067618 [Nannospalax galili]|uniref:uncharacterized protein LOC115067618 n=1 Tax=Nannospalax galili TaxID=1026970 RepID=UPI00111C5013|nr:uncharacterized protein LOC115067618 [Nannospalax galili]
MALVTMLVWGGRFWSSRDLHPVPLRKAKDPWNLLCGRDKQRKGCQGGVCSSIPHESAYGEHLVSLYPEKPSPLISVPCLTSAHLSLSLRGFDVVTSPTVATATEASQPQYCGDPMVYMTASWLSSKSGQWLLAEEGNVILADKKFLSPHILHQNCQAGLCWGGASGTVGAQQCLAWQGLWVELTDCRGRGRSRAILTPQPRLWLHTSISHSQTHIVKRLLGSLMGLLCTQVCWLKGQQVEQSPGALTLQEGENCDLQCNFSNSASNLQWFHQNPQGLLISLFSNPSGTKQSGRLKSTTDAKERRSSLHISSSQTTDSGTSVWWTHSAPQAPAV